MSNSTMRELIDLLTQSDDVEESGPGPSRILHHIRSGVIFIMLSAMRGDKSHEENLRRTKKLRSMLTALPVSFIPTEGEYQEDGRDEPSPERSFFVMPKKGNVQVNAEQFRKFGIKLMHAFDQDSILYGDGALASLIFADGTTMDLGDTLTFRPDVISDLGGFSKIKKRKFSFTDRETAGKASQTPAPPSKTTGGVGYGSGKVAA